MIFSGKLSIIIPCYNEQEIIRETHRRIQQSLQKCEVKETEIIYINDGSEDATFDLLLEFSQENPEVKVIDFARNFGHQAAISAGIHHCTGDLAIIIDADLQDPPELFADLIETYQRENCNVVFCVRRNRHGESWLKKITAKMFYRFISRICERPFPQDTGDFRLIDRMVMEEFKKLKEKNKFIRGLIFWLGFRQVPFYFERDSRKTGATKYSLARMVRFAVTGITYFSNKPLIWAFKVGIAIIIMAAIIFMAFFWFGWGQAVSPYSFKVLFISVLFILFGLHFIILGILGIYLKNIFDELKDRPEYIIREIING